MIPFSLARYWKAAFCSMLALTTAQACGPDFYPDTFVRVARPDLPEQFVKGKLGLLQPGFARADLFVAYRYLNGGALDHEEQLSWKPTYPLSEEEYGTQSPELPTGDGSPTSESPVDRWLVARKSFPDAPAGSIEQQGSIEVHTAQGFQYEDHFLNCADDAFRTATETLAERVKLWGSESPALLDWLRGQDTVFSNCAGGAAIPSPAPAGSSQLLMADRAYQTAAAHFYGKSFPEAAQEFVAISHDRSSPWQPISGYLAARVLIRQAFFARPNAEARADYDPAIMRSAEEQLRGYVAGAPAPMWRNAAEKQLALIRIRLEPDQRTRELAALVSGPGHDGNYAQDLKDLLWITDAKTPEGLRAQPELYRQVPDETNPKGMRFVTAQEAEKAAADKRQTAFTSSATVRSLAPIVDWTVTFQSLSAEAPQHALQQWKTTHTLAWLVAALALAPGTTAPHSDLLDAAAVVSSESPAWEVVNYHRARLLLAAGRLTEARTVLTGLSEHLQQLPAAEREPSTVNAVRGLQMLAAPTAAGFLSFAPRTMLLAASEEYSSFRECQEVMKHPARHHDCLASVGTDQLDEDAARTFNEQVPLSFWLEAAQSSSFSPRLRVAIAEEALTRAILLGSKAEIDSFLPLVPETLRRQVTAGPLGPWMALARNPGLRPYLNAGTQRAYSYDFVESYRDNWCYKPDQFSNVTLPASFLNSDERQNGMDQARRLANIRSLYVGRQIINGVQANVQDPQAAEALFLVLRMIRYGCTEPTEAVPVSDTGTVQIPALPYRQESDDLLQLKRDAARLLRQHYAASPWTKKAAPFVG